MEAQEAQSKEHMVYPTLCLALWLLGETYSLWLVVCGGLMPFYETSEEKPKSNCSVLWYLSDSSPRSCSFSQFLFILLRVSTALYLPVQILFLSFDEEILLKNRQLIYRRLQLMKKAQGFVCAVLSSRRLQPLGSRSQVTTQKGARVPLAESILYFFFSDFRHISCLNMCF